MWRQALIAFFPLAVLIAIPLLLRPAERQRSAGPDDGGGDRLVIVTPNSESIRYEFGRAFREYYRRRFGREITLEWRTPGGTSDIVRFIADSYEAAFRNAWNADPANPPWTDAIAAGFADPGVQPGNARPREVVAARRKFLASQVGIGIDLMFGGGQFDQRRQADKGYAVDAGMQRLHPDWFRPEIMPQQFSGETFYDPDGRYYGACLAAFGLCWNRQRLAAMTDPSPPRTWAALGEPRFFQQIAIADPTKSGSVNKCFEMMVQQQM
ncbi:MAG: ABC transporter substrate-binding protein, partial [Victivallales bacterium]|nr:ABC transporter substrate-binding protein [Victivallales bacterium]